MQTFRHKRRTGTKVHFGTLMSAASIKFWELAKHLQKVKGRIVYRGDCAKDEEGAAADEPFSEVAFAKGRKRP